jgi:hypothetical protein
MKNWISLTILLTALIFISSCFSAFPQVSDYKDRLGSVRDLVNSNELIMIWNQGESQSSQNCYQRIFDLDLTHPGEMDSILIRKPLQIDSAITDNYSMAVATGNFLNGSFKHFVSAWKGPGNTITVSIPEIQSGTLSWINSNRLVSIRISGNREKKNSS